MRSDIREFAHGSRQKTTTFEPFSLSTFPVMSRSRSPRAYVLRLPRGVSRNIEAFRDPVLEAVIKAGGTPSCRAMKAFTFEKCGQFPWIKPRIRGCKVYTLEWEFRDPCSSCELLQLTGVRNDPCFGGCKPVPMVLWNTNRMVQSEPLLRRRGLM